MTKPARKIQCPTCGKPVEWRPENQFRPFCSERCKQIDLGAWASETYRIPGDTPNPDDLDEEQRKP